MENNKEDTFDKMEISIPNEEELNHIQFQGDSWKEEAKQIPLEQLKPRQAYLIQKYINNDKITIDEETEIIKILEKYRYAIHSIEPAKVVQGFQENHEFESARAEFLQYADKFKNVNTITMNYPFTPDNVKTYTFDVHPLTDNQAIFNIKNSLSIFEDFNDEEFVLYCETQTGRQLTPEEQAIWTNIQNKIEKVAKRDETKVMREYLALCVTFHGEDNTREEMLEVFNHMKPIYVGLLFSRVQDLQPNSNVKIEEVFPEAN